MGSFNTSCFVSNQVIIPGDEVVLFPMVPSSGYESVVLRESNEEKREEHHNISGFQYRSSNCYSTANFKPIGVFLTGEYADYGRFELNDTPENRLSLVIFLEYVKTEAYITLAGDNEYHDHPFNPKDLVWDESTSFADLHKMWEMIGDVGFHEDRIFVSGRGDSNPLQLSIGVLHKHAADSLIKLIDEHVYYDYRSTNEDKYTSTNSDQFTQKAFDEYMSKDVLFNSVRDCYRMGEGSQMPEYLTSLVKLRVRKTRFGADSDINFDIENQEPEVLSDEAKVMFLLNMATKYYYIATGIEHLGIRYSPQVYTSQDYSNEQGKSYMKFVAEVNAKIAKDHPTDEDEE